MSKLRRFPTQFFKGRQDDPLLDDAFGLDDNPGPRTEKDRVASLANIFAPSFDETAGPDEITIAPGEASNPDDLRVRDYVVNSIFAPQDLREEGGQARQQLVFIKEHEGTLEGMEEVNALIRSEWRVVNAFATGNSAFYKALVLLERS